MIEQLVHNYPSESKAEFRTPLVWMSKILPSAFSSAPNSSIWAIKDASKSHKTTVSSLTLRHDGQPVFSMEQNESGFKAKVSSFEYLQKFLEVQQCISEN